MITANQNNILPLMSLAGFLCLLFFSYNLTAQGTKMRERTRLRVEYFKLANSDKNIRVSLIAGRGRNMQYVADADILLKASAEGDTIELGRLRTDAEGIMSLNIVADYRFAKDANGFTSFQAVFEGNDTLMPVSRDIDVKDIDFRYKFEIVDSVKILTLHAYETDKKGNEIPVKGVDIIIGVQRLYSVLEIGEVETDEEGVGIMEFPDDIPGDEAGNLVIVGKIHEHDDYGTVYKTGEVQWGIPVSYEVEPLPRQLWTDEAPLWMIISVFVILSGAWYHFFLSVIKLRKMKKEAHDNH